MMVLKIVRKCRNWCKEVRVYVYNITLRLNNTYICHDKKDFFLKVVVIGNYLKYITSIDIKWVW